MKGYIITGIILFILLVVASVVVFTDIEINPFNIILDKDSIYVHIPDRAYTFVEVADEIQPYENIYIDILQIAPDGERSYGQYICGAAVGNYCPNMPMCPVGGYSKDQMRECCQQLGYSSYETASVHNCLCYKDVVLDTGWVKIFVGGTEVYYWDGVGAYPTSGQSENIATIVNEQCYLTAPEFSCSDSLYLSNTDKTKCVYFQPTVNGTNTDCLNPEATRNDEEYFGEDFIKCEMSIIQREPTGICQVRLDVQTESGAGYLNLGLSWDGRGQTGEILIVQPPVFDPNTGEVDETPEIPKYIEQPDEDINIFKDNWQWFVLFGLLILGGIVIYGKFKLFS